MTRKSAIDRALDVLVYAPIGVAITIVEDLPHAVERGRQRLGATLEAAGLASPDGRPTARPAPTPAPQSSGEPTPDAGELAIPGYGALSASQVVQRLAGLSADQLETVRTYEAATRHRRTILSRIAQLQADK